MLVCVKWNKPIYRRKELKYDENMAKIDQFRLIERRLSCAKVRVVPAMAAEAEKVEKSGELDENQEHVLPLNEFIGQFDRDLPQEVTVDNIHMVRYDGSFRKVATFWFLS